MIAAYVVGVLVRWFLCRQDARANINKQFNRHSHTHSRTLAPSSSTRTPIHVSLRIRRQLANKRSVQAKKARKKNSGSLETSKAFYVPTSASVCVLVSVLVCVLECGTADFCHPHRSRSLKVCRKFLPLFVNEILIKLQAKKEFAEQVWRVHTPYPFTRTSHLRLYPNSQQLH